RKQLAGLAADRSDQELRVSCALGKALEIRFSPARGELLGRGRSGDRVSGAAKARAEPRGGDGPEIASAPLEVVDLGNNIPQIGPGKRMRVIDHLAQLTESAACHSCNCAGNDLPILAVELKQASG